MMTTRPAVLKKNAGCRATARTKRAEAHERQNKQCAKRKCENREPAFEKTAGRYILPRVTL